MAYRHKKHFGQHFLNDKVLIDQLVTYIQPKATDMMVEIGPGGGALTFPLMQQLNTLYAVEVDQDCAANLQAKLKDKSIVIFNKDILKFFLSEIDEAAKPLKRVVGNLPYNISTPILFHLFKQLDHIEDIHIMVQLEVAERICAQVNEKQYGRLSVMAQYFCDTQWLCDIGPESFDPPPKVDSAFIALYPKRDRDESIEAKLTEIVAAAFNQRRKTISNSLKKYMTRDDFDALDIQASKRAENLSLTDYINIAKFVLAQGK